MSRFPKSKENRRNEEKKRFFAFDRIDQAAIVDSVTRERSLQGRAKVWAEFPRRNPEVSAREPCGSARRAEGMLNVLSTFPPRNLRISNQEASGWMPWEGIPSGLRSAFFVDADGTSRLLSQLW